MSDSHSTPMRRGASGISLAYHGFHGLKDYRGTPDIFGRLLRMEQANIADGLAAAAVLVMGEGNEQTLLVIVSDTGDTVSYDAAAPSMTERASFLVDLKDDIFAPLINFRRMQPGKRGHTPPSHHA